jgi:hypothetical protein
LRGFANKPVDDEYDYDEDDMETRPLAEVLESEIEEANAQTFEEDVCIV